MAVLSFTPLSISTFRAKPLIGPSIQYQQLTSARSPNQHASYSPPVKIIAAQFRIPDEAKRRVKTVQENLCKSLPDSVKNLPWKKIEDQVTLQLLYFGKETFKWSFLAWFVLSFLSDILFTMSRNQELAIPFGLFVGYFLSNFMKEISDELFQESQVKDMKKKFMGITSVLVLFKFVSVFLGIQGRLFLVHLANGGLMQILWLWKRSEEGGVDDLGNAQVYGESSM